MSDPTPAPPEGCRYMNLDEVAEIHPQASRELSALRARLERAEADAEKAIDELVEHAQNKIAEARADADRRVAEARREAYERAANHVEMMPTQAMRSWEIGTALRALAGEPAEEAPSEP